MSYKKKINQNKIKFISIKNVNIKKNLLNKILKLKIQHYKFSYNNQLKWFRDNIRNGDIHNLLLYKNNPVGYNCLRLKKITRNKIVRKVFIFDTCVIDKKFRGEGLGGILMNNNNQIIKKYRIPSFLLCKNNVLNFYKKFKWIKINKKIISFKDHSTKKSNLLCFNFPSTSVLNYKIKLN